MADQVQQMTNQYISNKESNGDLKASHYVEHQESHQQQQQQQQQLHQQTQLQTNGMVEKTGHDSAGDMENRTNLIVNYLPQTMSQEEMRNLFSKIGKLASCKLIRDKLTGQSLGYGFVNYVDPLDAERAIRALNKMKLHNKTIKVSLARPSCESIKGANLYICGLPKTMTEAELEKLFHPCGKIITSRILFDSNTGQSKGVGFIRFDQRHEAELAIQQFNGYRLGPTSDTPLVVKFANIPTSGKTGQVGLNALSQFTVPGLQAQSMATLSSLINMNKLVPLKGTDLQAALAHDLLNGSDPLAEFTAAQSVDGNQLLGAGGKANRRVGGPVHPSTIHRLRFNPLDGCAIPVRVNPFDSTNSNSLTCLTSSPAAAAGLRLMPKMQDSNVNATISLAAALAAASNSQSESIHSHLLPHLNGSRVPVNMSLGVPWIGSNLDSNLNSLNGLYSSGAALGDLLNQSNNTVLPNLTQNPISILNRPDYYGTTQISSIQSTPHLVNPKANGLNLLNLNATNTTANNNANLAGQSRAGLTNVDQLLLGHLNSNTDLNSVSTSTFLQNLNSRPVTNQSHLFNANNNGLFSTSNPTNNQTTSILKVEGLAPGTDESIVLRLFSAFPSVTSVQLTRSNRSVIEDTTGEPQSITAYVTMSDQEQARLALHYLNGCTLQNRVLKITMETVNQSNTLNLNDLVHSNNLLVVPQTLLNTEKN